MSKTDILIVGNGIAGLSCAEELRKEDKNLKISIVGRESYPTYYRVKLTKTLAEDAPIDKILVKKEDWYRENKIDLILNEIVEKVDEEGRKVVLDSGRELEYSQLVIATGSRPFVPPVPGKFRRGVFALRDYDDLGQIKSYIADLDQVAVIGGGLLGLEAAWALKDLGKKVHIIEMAPNILPRQLNLEMSKRLEEDLLAEGFELHLGVASKEIFGDDRMEGIELDNGEIINVKSVLFSVGVKPYMDLVLDTSIETQRGIVVDEGLRTNVDNIYAAGDVIEFKGRTMGLWTSSMEQGRLVAANILGRDLVYKPKNPFTSLRLGSSIDIFSIGDIENPDTCHRLEGEGFSERLFIKDGFLVGGILYGKSKNMMKLKKAVEAGLGLEEYLQN